MSRAVTLKAWLALLALVVLWGGAYGLTSKAVASLPPDMVVAGRVSVGAILLLAILYGSGGRLARLANWRQWAWYFAIGMTGMALPFICISIAQKTVESSVAGIFVAATPIVTVTLAHFLVSGEQATARSALGFIVGLAGVLLLLIPGAYGALGAGTLSDFALLTLASVFYATSTILTKFAPTRSPLEVAAGFVTCAALVMVPFTVVRALIEQTPAPTAADWPSLFATLALGIGPTGLASLLFVYVVRSAGPSFFALVNYLIPTFAIGVGWLLLNETLHAFSLAAFGLILIGVALAQKRKPDNAGQP